MVKSYQVVITSGARQSLKDITDYIRRTDSDKQANYVRVYPEIKATSRL